MKRSVIGFDDNDVHYPVAALGGREIRLSSSGAKAKRAVASHRTLVIRKDEEK